MTRFENKSTGENVRYTIGSLLSEQIRPTTYTKIQTLRNSLENFQKMRLIKDNILKRRYVGPSDRDISKILGPIDGFSNWILYSPLKNNT